MLARLAVVVLAASIACGSAALAQERVPLASDVTVDGYLFRPAGTGPSPAVVFVHGCGGLLSTRGAIESREQAWARELTALGYLVLMVDSFSARGVKGMCAPRDFRSAVLRARTGDALAALRWLQARPDVRADRIGLVGWSEGGGVVLRTLQASDEFAAAVAFYPASCSLRALGTTWAPRAPLLVLTGANDVWTVAPPCKALLDDAAARGARVTYRIYPGAYHDFDWPGVPVHALPQYRTAAGVVPIAGTNAEAMADARARVPGFFATYLQR